MKETAVNIQHVFTGDECSTIMQQPVLVALSGGADSVALLRLLLQAGCDCRAAHCNFHLRGEESMRDERFVCDLCLQLNVPLAVRSFDVPAYQRQHGGSVEMACREMRYAWFEQERQRLGCSVIAVAHHADDQVETFFLNLMRGTGSRGLAGMQRSKDRIWRPLLHVGRQEILDYLKDIGQDYVTDSTNAHNDYRRNRLRNIVLPTISEQFPQATERVLDTMDNIADDHALLLSLVSALIPDERHIDIHQLLAQQQASTLLYHRIRHMGFSREQCSQAIVAARQGNTGRQFPSNNHLLVVNRNTLDIEDTHPMTAHVEIPFDPSCGLLSPVHITATRGDAPFTPLMCDGKATVAFNISLLECQHIVLRHWRKGDRFKPFGMHGSKLVSDLFADLKLDHAARHKAWLLQADGEIIWVVGYRCSSHFDVDKEAQDYLLLKLI